MTPKNILKAALNLLRNDVEWVQGDYVVIETAAGRQTFGAGARLVPFVEPIPSVIMVDGKAIPTAMATRQACAIGLVELALADKGFDPKFGDYLDSPELKAVRQYLDAAIQERLTLSELKPHELGYLREDYDYYVGNMACYRATEGGSREILSFEEWVDNVLVEQYDGVEDWNDRDGRTVEEVIAVFERAIELAPNRVIGSPAATREVGSVTAALTA